MHATQFLETEHVCQVGKGMAKMAKMLPTACDCVARPPRDGRGLFWLAYLPAFHVLETGISFFFLPAQ
jgi:hypothetical protein